MVCEVYLKLRDSTLREAAQKKALPRMPYKSQHIIDACDVLMRGLAHVGIVALVDEATGYQQVRDRDALEKILNEYIGKELAKWAKRFPDDFYEQMFRLKAWKYTPGNSKRPMQMAKITIDIVYDRIGPGLTKELRERRQEIFENTGRRGKLNQVLTPDVGHPALQNHLSGVTFSAKGFKDGDWDGFHHFMDRVAPRYNRTLLLPLGDDGEIGSAYPVHGR
jgi:hypothetical protein